MSYCRWSSDGFGCDVYVYEGQYGYVCHVAARKIINLHEAPHVPSFFDYPETPDGKTSDESIKDFMTKHRAFSDWLDKSAIRENIGLEFDGETITTDSATSMANELVLLKQMGYQVPQYAIDALYEEGLENGEQAEI
jgi:hypothetical protein